MKKVRALLLWFFVEVRASASSASSARELAVSSLRGGGMGGTRGLLPRWTRGGSTAHLSLRRSAQFPAEIHPISHAFDSARSTLAEALETMRPRSGIAVVAAALLCQKMVILSPSLPLPLPPVIITCPCLFFVLPARGGFPSAQARSCQAGCHVLVGGVPLV